MSVLYTAALAYEAAFNTGMLHAGWGGRGGVRPSPLGGSEGVARQRRRAALLLASPRFLDFATCL